MTTVEQEQWMQTTECSLYVAKEYYHHHAYEIINTHAELRDNFKRSLTSNIPVVPSIRSAGTKKSKGVKADNLNIEIRNLLKRINQYQIKFEVNEERGVFYFSSEKGTIGGFDFAILNHTKNLTALRNLCFGEIHFHEGELKWQKFLEKNQDLNEIAENLLNRDLLGSDIEYSASTHQGFTPLVVGEIQFGNWALVYRDFFKVLKANVQNSIDCLIYVVPTGNLESMLSEGIVTFDNTKKILEEFAKVISVPVWIVGIDVS